MVNKVFVAKEKTKDGKGEYCYVGFQISVDGETYVKKYFSNSLSLQDVAEMLDVPFSKVKFLKLGESLTIIDNSVKAVK